VDRGGGGGGGGSISVGGRCTRNDKCVTSSLCMSTCEDSNDTRPSCSFSSDCLKIAQAKCKPGEKLPHNECILSGERIGWCEHRDTCGVDQCSSTNKFDKICYANRKCNDGEVKPHYECIYSTKKCEIVDDCGKNSCDPKKTENLKVNVGGVFKDIEINSECKGSEKTPSVYD